MDSMAKTTPTALETLTILGAGQVGTVIAGAAVDAGYTTYICGSGDAEAIRHDPVVVESGAVPASAATGIARSEMVLLAVPWHRHRGIDPEPLAGKILIDVMNYWAPIDGQLHSLEEHTISSSEIVAQHFAAARVVKSLNHLSQYDLDNRQLPPGDPGRRGVGVASDDQDAARQVMLLVDQIGFDPVFSGPLASGAAFEPGSEIFAERYTASQLREALIRALGQQ
ncbi:NADPH-dependent F420 reductase [Glutamicibacter endophyticus]|uniref:NADPH-dependent F420 reductase n=1 Tax=Glutamicibacter endophyticus TaxID=1522174 RepID=UPI003AF1CE4C